MISEGFHRIVSCRSGMNDQWLLYRGRGFNVTMKTLVLPRQIALDPVLVEPGFANGYAQRVAGGLYELVQIWLVPFLGVGVDANRRRELFVLLGHCQHLLTVFPCGCDAQHVFNFVGSRILKHIVKAVFELRKIKVAM